MSFYLVLFSPIRAGARFRYRQNQPLHREMLWCKETIDNGKSLDRGEITTEAVKHQFIVPLFRF